jgi:hypothetical protein
VTTDRTHITVTLFGTVVIDQEVIKETTREGCFECANVLTNNGPDGEYLSSTCSGPPYWTESTAATINGVSSPGTNIYAAHEVRQLAQNLHYVATYTSQANNEATHDMDEHVILVDEIGSASTLWSGTYTDTYRAASSFFPDLPNDRELVWGYQPVTGESTHGQLTLFVFYSGDTYLYV